MNSIHALLTGTLLTGTLRTGALLPGALLPHALMVGILLTLPAAHAADMPASAPAEVRASQVEAGVVVSPGPGATPHSAPEQAAASAPHTAAPASAPAQAERHQAAPKPAVQPKVATPEIAPPEVAPKAAAPRKKSARTRRHAASPREERERKPAAAPLEKKALPSVSLDERQNHNPVLEAIELVATSQQAEIQAADKKVSESDWWTDTLERNWIVRRPFGPGIFDSTHWFYVSYKVNGRILMSWFVDLNKGTVSAIAPPEQQSLR